MTKEEIISRSQSERYNYPDVFLDDFGIGINILDYTTVPSWDYSKRQSRKVTLKVSSYSGQCPGAVHVYGRLKIEGVVLKKVGENRPMRMPNIEHTAENPFVAYSYELILQRPVTQKDKDDDKNARCEADIKFDYCEVGDLTYRWDTFEELLNFAKLVFKTRFEGNWELWLDCDWDTKPTKIL